MTYSFYGFCFKFSFHNRHFKKVRKNCPTFLNKFNLIRLFNRWNEIDNRWTWIRTWMNSFIRPSLENQKPFFDETLRSLVKIELNILDWRYLPKQEVLPLDKFDTYISSSRVHICLLIQLIAFILLFILSYKVQNQIETLKLANCISLEDYLYGSFNQASTSFLTSTLSILPNLKQAAAVSLRHDRSK